MREFDECMLKGLQDNLASAEELRRRITSDRASLLIERKDIGKKIEKTKEHLRAVEDLVISIQRILHAHKERVKNDP